MFKLYSSLMQPLYMIGISTENKKNCDFKYHRKSYIDVNVKRILRQCQILSMIIAIYSRINEINGL